MLVVNRTIYLNCHFHFSNLLLLFWKCILLHLFFPSPPSIALIYKSIKVFKTHHHHFNKLLTACYKSALLSFVTFLNYLTSLLSKMDPAMCIGVVSLLHPLGQGWMRCAGQQGVVVFQDCVECNSVPYYAELMTPALLVVGELGEEGCIGDNEDEALGSVSSTFSSSRAHHHVSTTTTTNIPIGDDSTPWKALYSYFIQPQPKHFQRAVINWSLYRTTGRLLHDINTTKYSIPRVLHVVNCDDLTGLFYWLGQQVECGAHGEVHISVSYTIRALPSLHAATLPHLQTMITSVTFSEGSSISTFEGGGFLQGCTTLKSFDMSPFNQVPEIPDRFFRGGCALVELPGLSNMRQVKYIGSQFLSGCSSFPSITLDAFINVTRISADFMRGCTSLSEISLVGLKNVSHIGNGFLFGCSGLISTSSSIDLTPLIHLEVIGDAFLGRCTGLSSLNLHPLTPKLRCIGTHFLQECCGLSSVDLEPLSGIQYVPAYFLYGCRGLQDLNFNPLRHAEVDLHGFIEFCDHLQYNALIKDVKYIGNVEFVKSVLK